MGCVAVVPPNTLACLLTSAWLLIRHGVPMAGHFHHGNQEKFRENWLVTSPLRNEGFYKLGTPIAAWFISWKMPTKSGWWLGVSLFQETLISEPLKQSKSWAYPISTSFEFVNWLSLWNPETSSQRNISDRTPVSQARQSIFILQVSRNWDEIRSEVSTIHWASNLRFPKIQNRKLGRQYI